MDPMTAQAIASVGGTVLGGLMGKKKQSSTVTNKPYIKPNYDKEYDRLAGNPAKQ
jgi:hypothetical protein